MELSELRVQPASRYDELVADRRRQYADRLRAELGGLEDRILGHQAYIEVLNDSGSADANELTRLQRELAQWEGERRTLVVRYDEAAAAAGPPVA